jgi:hypothetical protein
VEVHKLVADQELRRAEAGCAGSLEGALRFLVAREVDGYDFGIEEWTLLRLYQGAILQGVLQDILFAGAAACADYDEYRRFIDDYARLKEAVFAVQESFHGPGAAGRALVRVFGTPAKLFAYRLHGRDLAAPLRRFAAKWLGRRLPGKPLHIHVSGEVYMRIAQAEEIFRTLLSTLGFRRFRLEVAPVWGYLEYLVEEAADGARQEAALAAAALARGDGAAKGALYRARAALRRLGPTRWMLRNLLARPLYAAAGLPLPKSAAQTMAAAREVLPTLRPIGELAPYIGEVLLGLREGGELFINVAPAGCMVSAMGQVLSPRLKQAVGGEGRIQQLFSGDGEVNEQQLAMAALKCLGPRAFCGGGDPGKGVC